MTEKWIKDTGLTAALVLIGFGYKGNRVCIIAAALLILAAMLVPKILYPLAWLWQKVVEILGVIVPKVFFSIVFFLVVLPVGALRRMIKGDLLIVKSWKEANTAFVTRDHCYDAGDLSTPF